MQSFTITNQQPSTPLSERDGTVQPEIQTYRASDGYLLHYHQWRPKRRPRGRVVYLHGIQSHGGWFELSCRRMRDAGYEVSFLDRRGSGLNQVDRGHAESWQQLVDDVITFLQMSRRDGSEARLPTMLLGVSWGGKLAAAVAREAQDVIDGLALLYPGIGSRVKPCWYQAVLLRAACRLGFGRRRLPSPLDDPSLFTTAHRWQQFIAEDRLSLREMSLGLLLASHELDCHMQGLPEQIQIPTLMMLAARDRLIDNDVCRRFSTRLATKDKKLIEYSEAQHTLEFEPDPEPFLCDLLDWLQTVTATGATRPSSNSGRAST